MSGHARGVHAQDSRPCLPLSHVLDRDQDLTLATFRAALRKLAPLEWAKLLLGNGLLIGFMVAGRLSLIDLLLLMTLEAIGLNLATMIASLATGRMTVRRLPGYLTGVVFLLGWGWIWTLVMLVDNEPLLWARLFSAPTSAENLLRQPQIMLPLLTTLAGVLVMPSVTELGRSALSPTLQLFTGPTLGLIVALFGSALLGRGHIEPAFFVAMFLACRFGVDLVLRIVATDEPPSSTPTVPQSRRDP